MSSGPSQHYTFVHRALPSIFFRDPSWFFAVLNGPDATRFLGDVWQQVGERTQPDARGSADGLAVETFVHAGLLFAVITMPTPGETTEAHLVAAVAGFRDAESPALDALAWSRFFTLEHGLDFTTEAPCTFLCEWTRDGTHRNLGDGPAADTDAFVEALIRQVSAPPN